VDLPVGHFKNQQPSGARQTAADSPQGAGLVNWHSSFINQNQELNIPAR
jgi:hypothetical protein